MKPILRQFRHLFAMLCLFVFATKASAQGPIPQFSRQLKEFNHLTNEANVTFTLPESFREIPAYNEEDMGMDYGIVSPGNDFEIWFSVKSYKYLSRYSRGNPDSAYLKLVKEQINNLSADNDYFVRNLSPKILSQYKADEGKSYLVNLNDMPETRHYRYALIIVLQKNHTGSIMAMCLSNEKGPEFFRTIDKAKGCIKFKS